MPPWPKFSPFESRDATHMASKLAKATPIRHQRQIVKHRAVEAGQKERNESSESAKWRPEEKLDIAYYHPPFSSSQD